MKILYLMSEFPYPPRGGGALRIMGLVTGAARAGHDIHILSFGVELNHTPLHDLCASIEMIPSPQRSKTDRIKTLLLSSHADMERRNWSDDFLKALERKLQQNHFDIVQFQSLEMGIYLRHVRHIQPEAKLIYDAYNAEAELQHMVYETDRQNLKMLPMAFYSWMQWKRLSTFERQLCQNADAVIAVSEIDQHTLQKIAGKTPVYMVNNGIDVSDYATAPDVKLDLQPPALIFTGIMDYRPNVDAAVWFAEDIFPKIRHPGVHLY
ncbi:MAG TPA: glycosyltransferase, partial [Aggregatilineales bacterium]|nr:glycosyltransferase [Aggregatilineales bacterium]